MKRLIMGMLVFAGMLMASCTADDQPETIDVKQEGNPGGSNGGIPPPPPPPPCGGC